MDLDTNSLLELARRVNSSSTHAIKLLKTTSLANAKTLRRACSANRTAPLDSTISLIYTKYPLSLDKKKAVKCNIPREYMTGIYDKHTSGRVLARLEAINWYMMNAQEASQETLDSIKLLMQDYFDKYNMFVNIAWNEIPISWGPVFYQRMVISLNHPSVDIPPAEITRSLLYVLGIRTLPPPLAPTLISSLEALRDKLLVSNITLMRQYNLLMKYIRPISRYVPFPINLSTQYARILPALSGAFYTCRPTILPSTQETRKDLVKQSCRALHFAYIANMTEEHSLVPLITIEGQTLSNCLVGIDPIDVSIKLATILLGGRSTITYYINKVKIDLEDHCPRAIYAKYKDKTVKVVKSTVAIRLEYPPIIAKVSLCDGEIYSMSTTYGSREMFLRVLVSLANFLEWRQERYAKLEKSQAWVAREKHIRRDTSEFLGHRLTQWVEGARMGCLSIGKISVAIPEAVQMERMGHNRFRTPKGFIWSVPQLSTRVYYPDNVICPLGWPTDGYNPPVALSKRISYYIMKFDDLQGMIHRERWGYMNECFRLGLKDAAPVSGYCRALAHRLLKQLEKEDINPSESLAYKAWISLTYCFAKEEPHGSSIKIGSSFKFHDQEIDLMLSKGLVRISGPQLLVGDKPLEIGSIQLSGSILGCTTLPGFRIQPATVEDNEDIKTIEQLQVLSSSMIEGDSFKLYWHGMWKVVKDSDFAMDVHYTLKRGLVFDDDVRFDAGLLSKRRRFI